MTSELDKETQKVTGLIRTDVAVHIWLPDLGWVMAEWMDTAREERTDLRHQATSFAPRHHIAQGL